MKITSRGFTLIELLIAIAIVGILVTIALPSYHQYTRRAHYAEIVHAAAPYKLGVEECFQVVGDLKSCTAGQHGVPINIHSGQGSGLIDTITVGKKGSITIKPKAKYGIKASDTYELIPHEINGRLEWNTAGGGKKAGYAN